MPFGSRRFTQLVYRETRTAVAGDVVSWYEARFVPLSFEAGDEYVTEDVLRREVNDNACAAQRLPDGEEHLALRAFDARARNRTSTRAAVEGVAERAAQRVMVDPLDGGERAQVERFRRLVLKLSTPERKDDPDFGRDAMRAVLMILDKYFHHPKGI